MNKKTPLYALHVAANAKMVDFAGFEMPLHYGSQLKEHHAVRNGAGIFDVSHMGIVDCQGREILNDLRSLIANNIDRIPEGKALYTCMLNEQGGVIDDLIVYKIAPDRFRLVINAGRRERDLAWLKAKLSAPYVLRDDLIMLAVQGPKAQEKLLSVNLPLSAEAIAGLKPFSFLMQDEWFIARTGYTGEDGYEIMLPSAAGEALWKSLLSVGVTPCGLGARDTLRLEAGLNLYGADMDETVTPFESNLGWTVALDPPERIFIGRSALENQLKSGINRCLVGLVLSGGGILRNHQKIRMEEGGEGEVTSGGYSPTLLKSIALARVPPTSREQCFAIIRNKAVPARIVKPPFVRQGKKMI